MVGRRSMVILAAALAYAALGAGAARAQDERERPQRQRRLQLDIGSGRAAAVRLISRGRYEEAIAILEPMSEADPERADIADLLSTCYLRSGMPGKAIELLEPRLATEPRRQAYVRNLAAAYLDAGRKDDALGLWESLLGDSEEDAPFYGIVASMQWDAGMHDLALETLGRGARFPSYFDRAMMETIRLERVLGRYREAFGTAVRMYSGLEDPMRGYPGMLLETWKEAGRDTTLLGAVDSLALGGGRRGRFFAMMSALLRADGGDYGPLSDYVSKRLTKDSDPAEAYYLASSLMNMREHRGDPGFRKVYGLMLDQFSGRFSRSSVVPQMLLAAARFTIESGDEAAAGKGAEHGARPGDLYERALALADSAAAHPAARAYEPEAALLKAELLVRKLHRPEEAISVLRSGRWTSRERGLEAARLRLEAGLALERYDETESWLLNLESSGDSTLEALAGYGRGMLELYRGDYDRAVSLLSESAGKYPSSEWANDALSYAVTVKKAAPAGGGCLDLFVSAMKSAAAGEALEASRAFEELAGRDDGCPAAPAALWERSLLLLSTGRKAEAIESLGALVERYPGDALAPRALERAAFETSAADPERAAGIFERLMEEYPGYPFMARVRREYLALEERIEGTGSKGVSE